MLGPGSGTIHSHSHLILDPGSAYYDDAGGGFAPSSVIGVGRSRIHDQVAVAVGGGGAVAVAVAGLTKRFFNHIQKDFVINVWGYKRLYTIVDRRCILRFFFLIFARDCMNENLKQTGVKFMKF